MKDYKMVEYRSGNGLTHLGWGIEHRVSNYEKGKWVDTWLPVFETTDQDECKRELKKYLSTQKPIVQVVEDVCEEICDKFCKFGQSNAKLCDDGTCGHFEDCPLNRLR